jgi:hypothetical protein
MDADALGPEFCRDVTDRTFKRRFSDPMML